MKRFTALLLSICILVGTAPLSTAAGSSSVAPASSDYVANEVILVQDTSVQAEEALPLESAVPIDTEALFAEEGVRTLKGTVAYGTDIEALCEALRARPDIISADPNYLQHIDSIQIPAEAARSGSDYNAFNWYRDNLELTQAWQSGDTLGADDITVAVLDTGVNIHHKEFAGAISEDDCYNAVDGSDNVTDSNGHGSNVAGIIAMRANDFGYVGIAPQVNIMPIKIAIGATMSDEAILNGINFAVENGADILNMSFGGTTLSSTMGLAYQRAARKAVLIAAAGNAMEDVEVAPQYPAACNGVLGVMSYGDYSNEARSHYTIDNGQLSSFSNYDKSGKYYQIAAPGVEIAGPSNVSDTGFTFKSGTSQACPIVAATAALYLSLHRQATPYQVKHALIAGSQKIVTGYTDDTPYKALDMTAVLAREECTDPVVPVSSDALRIFNACFNEQLTALHQSDLEDVTILSHTLFPEIDECVEAIAELYTVQVIELDGMSLQAEDVDWLQSAVFPDLYRLDLSRNAIGHLPFAANTAPNLRELYADNCELSSTDTLAYLPALKSLSLSGNNFVTSYQFEKLNALEELALDGCRLQDVRAFADFKELTYLDVSDNYITDISPLAYFGGTYLNIQSNPLSFGTRQDYYINCIDSFMKENVATIDQIRFYHADCNGSDKAYSKAQTLAFPTATYPRSAESAVLSAAVSPAQANVNSFARFLSESEKVQLNALTGSMTWNAADFPASEDIPVNCCPVAGFPETAGTVRIAAPEILAFTYENGSYTLLANAATEAVEIGGVRYTTRHLYGEDWLFTIPASLPYADTLRATAFDSCGAGNTVRIGTTPAEPAAKAKILSAVSDKAEYFTGETATIEVVTDSAANFLKVYDCNHATASVLSGYTAANNTRTFTLRVPLSAAGSYRYKCYASATEDFGIGASTVHFRVTQQAQSLKLTCESDSALYLSEGNTTLQLEPAFCPQSSRGEAVTYRSLDTAVATVDESGEVTARGYGETAIVATSASGLSAAFPVVVSVPRMSEPDITEGYVGAANYIEFYTRGAGDFALLNADGSPCTVPYEYEKNRSNISGYDTYWVIALYPTTAEPLNLKLYAVDDNGITAATNFHLLTLQPIAPVQDFSFPQSEYRFARTGGAVKIALTVTPADSTEYFNWSISTNTVATMKAYRNYCVLTPKKTGTVTLTASAMIDGRERAKSVTVRFTEGKIYEATTDVSAIDLYEEFPVTVTTDKTVSFVDVTDSNGLSLEFSDYTYYEDRGDYRYWTLPCFLRRDATSITVSGGDNIGNLGSTVEIPLTATMPQTDFAANPAVVTGVAGQVANFHLIKLPSRANIPFEQYTVTVEDESIATYNIGNVYLYKEGETTLHCQYGEESKEVRLIVSAPIESIEPSETALTLTEGESYPITATVTPASSEKITYTSSDESVATVSDSGVITAQGVGAATITLSAQNGVSAKVTVKVKSEDVITALSFDKTAYELEIPQSLDYTLAADADITNHITFESSNTKLLSVSADGTFTALKEGTVTITATADSGVSTTATVHITAHRQLALSRPEIETTIRSTIYVSTMLTPATADLDGYWYSDDPSVAVVNQSGTVYSKTPGSCRIYYISTRGEIVTCLVKVNDIALSRITPETDITLAVNENHIIEYTKYLAYSAESPQFVSEDESIAAVDQNGIIYGISAGTTTVIATIKSGKTYPISVTVTAPELTLRGTSLQAATLESENILGTKAQYAVEGDFAITPFTGGSYTFTLTALHHTSLTITDAQLFTSADLGELALPNGDANADGVIDFADITLLLATANYGKSVDASRRGMDIDDNGVINVNDLNVILLADNYGNQDKEIVY
ncbi:MAG: hypothetical protein E7517_03390 [Ruminococcaceae bacterium]|nr:hypothetical protein [Oscillospiraceae bacterium]